MSSSQTLHERVYISLRDSILSGQFRQGDRLTESKLAKQLQASRTPVREAIRRLQQEKLLTSDATDGVTIVEISLDSAIHLYDCRIALEQLAVTGACLLITSAQLKSLEQNLLASETLKEQIDSYETSISDEARYDLKQLALNYEFHRLIAESSQNPWLISLLDQLSNQIKLLRFQILQIPIDVEIIHAEHWQLFNAIQNRDIETAKQSIKKHLELSKERVIQVFKNTNRLTTRGGSGIACPSCYSHSIKKNGRRQNRQNYLCKDCGRQFIETMAYRSNPDD